MFSRRAKRIVGGTVAAGAGLYLGRRHLAGLMATPATRGKVLAALRKGGTLGRKAASGLRRRMRLGENAAGVRNQYRDLKRATTRLRKSR